MSYSSSPCQCLCFGSMKGCHLGDLLRKFVQGNWQGGFNRMILKYLAAGMGGRQIHMLKHFLLCNFLTCECSHVVDASETTVNHGAAHTRALRKAHIVRQRGQARAQRHHSVSKCENQWRQWRPSTSPQLSQDVEPKLSTQSAKVCRLI